MRRFFALAILITAITPSAIAQLSGTIITRDGAAIAGVDVRAYALESSADVTRRLRSEAPERQPLAKAATDEDGRFALEVKDHDVVNLVFSAEGYAPSGVSVVPNGEIGAFVLRAAKLKEGTVAFDGEPVEGAAARWFSGDVEVLARTDAKGRYRIPDPNVWRPSVEVHHPNGPVYRWEPEVFATRYRLDLDISFSGTVVSGVVVDADDSPASGAEIFVDDVLSGMSAEDGTFQVKVSRAWKEIAAMSGGQRGSVKRGRKENRIRLSAAPDVRGRVIDERGRGVGDASVSVAFATRGLPKPLVTLVTAKDGSFSSGPIASGQLQMEVRRPGFSDAKTQFKALPSAIEEQDITLSPACIVEGTIRDEDRRPVAAAKVTYEGNPLPWFIQQGVVSGPDGRYVMLDVPGSIKTKVEASPLGFAPSVGDSFESEPGVRLSRIDVTVTSGFEVSGRVVDPSGEPVEGAQVASTVHPQAVEFAFVSFPGMDPVEHPRTDRDGRFVVRVGSGTWYFSIKAPGYVIFGTEGKSIEDSIDLGELMLEEGGDLSGRVVRRDGSPVEDADVGFRDRDLRFARATTDVEGRFAFFDLPRKTTQVSAYKSDGSTAVTSVGIPASGVVIELPDVVTIRGRVVDAKTNDPIKDFAIGIGRSGPGSASRTPHHSDDGSFEVEAAVVEGIALDASAPGYASAKKLVALEEGSEPPPVEIALEKGVRVVGTVTDESGSALEGVQVSYEKKVSTNRGSLTMTESQVTTNARGEFSFDSVSPGGAQFSFAKQSYLRLSRELEASGPEARLDVELSQGLALRGIVVDGSGVPVVGADVRGSGSGELRSYAATKSGSDGRFVLEPLAPGHARVSAHASGYADTSIEDVTVEAAPELRLVMEEGATIEGEVLGIDSKAMQGVTLGLTNGGQYERRVTPDGTFRIEGVRVGRGAVYAYVDTANGSRASKQVEVDLVAGQVTHVQIEFPPGETVRGLVTLGDKPLAGSYVSFRPKQAYLEGFVRTRTDGDGRYEAVGLVDGEYQVTVMDPASRRSYETAYEVRGSAEFDIHVDEGRVEGRVVDADTREAIAGATVSVEVSGVSTMTSTAVSDADGKFLILSATNGELRLSARKDGYGVVVRQLQGESATSGIELAMVRSDGVKIRVVDARDGRALTPNIAIEDMAGNVLSSEWYRSTTDGAVKLEVAPGRYRVAVGANGYATRPVVITVPSGEQRVGLTPGGELTLRAPSGKAYRVTVRDASGFVVRRWPGAPEPTILIQGTVTLHAVAPGEYTVESGLVSGGATTVHRVHVDEGKSSELDLG